MKLEIKLCGDVEKTIIEIPPEENHVATLPVPKTFFACFICR